MSKHNLVCAKCREPKDKLYSTRNPNPADAIKSIAVCEACFPVVAGEPLRKK